ncbi:MAG: organic hydroperoxide resistance protein [Candidatus Sericytochromatia bacterium]
MTTASSQTQPVLLEKTLYTATATATAGRDGRAQSSDGQLDLTLAAPREMGGNGQGTNPEQLFAAGYAACFGSAAAHVARAQKIQTGPISVTGHVSIGPVGQAFGLAVVLEVAIPEMERSTAENLIATAHAVCPYSNATRGNIDVQIRLV